MAVTLKWSKEADKKFDKIIEYLEKEWGENVVRAFVKKTYDFLYLLCEFPEIGSVECAERQIRGFVLTKQVTVFYKLKSDCIILLSFYDNRQNPKKRKYGKNSR